MSGKWVRRPCSSLQHLLDAAMEKLVFWQMFSENATTMISASYRKEGSLCFVHFFFSKLFCFIFISWQNFLWANFFWTPWCKDSSRSTSFLCLSLSLFSPLHTPNFDVISHPLVFSFWVWVEVYSGTFISFFSGHLQLWFILLSSVEICVQKALAEEIRYIKIYISR